MLRYLVDESVHGHITRGVLRRRPVIDINMVRVQDAGLAGADDPAILEWAAQTGRVLLASDVSTLVGFAYERVRSGQPMPDVLVIRQGAEFGQVIDDVLLAAEASFAREWEGQVRYLPL